jgi:hypothetical protein
MKVNHTPYAVAGGQILILDDGVCKTIRNFNKYCQDFETSFEAVKGAYEAAEAAAEEAAAEGRQPFMISAKKGPSLEGRRKTYVVETTPLGYHKEPSTFQVGPCGWPGSINGFKSGRPTRNSHRLIAAGDKLGIDETLWSV